jgi:hypothetical protein
MLRAFSRRPGLPLDLRDAGPEIISEWSPTTSRWQAFPGLFASVNGFEHPLEIFDIAKAEFGEPARRHAVGAQDP